MAIISSGSEVCAEVRLAMALRFLAGGILWDIRSNFGVSVTELYRSLSRVVDAINDKFKIDLDLNDFDNLQ